jgi:hypothetical protein
MFRHSDKDDLPEFQGIVKNVSRSGLTLDAFKGIVHKKDGSPVAFSFGLCNVRWCDLPKDGVGNVTHSFPMESFTSATFDFVTFAVSWERITAQDQAKRDAEEEQKRKRAEDDARYAKAKAQRDAKDAGERARIRAACAAIAAPACLRQHVRLLDIFDNLQNKAPSPLGKQENGECWFHRSPDARQTSQIQTQQRQRRLPVDGAL